MCPNALYIKYIILQSKNCKTIKLIICLMLIAIMSKID